MTSDDLIVLQSIIHTLPAGKITCHSPVQEQIDTFQNCKIRVRDDWDIRYPSNEYFDILYFANVFMYISNPQEAFKNVFASCRYLLLQDIITCDRGANIFGCDGDCMRFKYGQYNSNYKEAFDLFQYEHRVRWFIPYLSENKNLHFITLMQGDL